MYNSCRLILHGLCFYPNEIVSCCYAPNDQINGCMPPVLFSDYKGEIIPKNELFAKMRQYSDQFKNGGCPEECKNCFQIKNQDWDESEYIDFIIITHYTRCNAACVYCSNNCNPEERTEGKYEILPFLRYLKNEGVLSPNLELHIGGGEFTIYKEGDAILDEFAHSAKIYINTNAVRFSRSLDNALKHGNTWIIVSLDSGSGETFKKIKRIDAFDKVIENVCKYSQGADKYKVTLKYIIIPGFNDNIIEFKKFLQIAKKAEIASVQIDIEARYLRSVSNKINPLYAQMARNMVNIARSEGFESDIYSFMQQSKAEKLTFNDIKDFISLKYLKSGVKKFYTNAKY